jgi:hypothetical protein
VESVERFMTYNMTYKKMMKVLDELWKEGHEILDIYYPEEIRLGEEEWSVDVYQDEINERCHLNWTWTVTSKKQLEKEDERENDLPDWVMVVEEPFSDGVVCKVVEKWLRDRGYEFGVEMISLEEARGSGMIKKLKQMDIESEKRVAVPIAKAMKELKEEENERMACDIYTKPTYLIKEIIL